jgi:four helix bundle protein
MACNGMVMVLNREHGTLAGMTSESIDSALLEWEATQPGAITKDPLWSLNCYREALSLIDLARRDVGDIGKQDPLSAAKGQLLTSIGSIAANIAEGYGRMTTADRTRFLSCALGSTREAITWYRTAGVIVGGVALEDRIDRLARVRRMLLGLLARLKQGGGRRFDPW